jgi:hypothetical protein
MPHHDHEPDETIPPRRRSGDAGIAKWGMGIAGTVAGGLLFTATLWLFSLNAKIAKMEAGEHVSKAEFAVLQNEAVNLRRDLDRLREWMRSHAQETRARGEVP